MTDAARTDDEILDLGWSIRGDTWRFDRLDAALNLIESNIALVADAGLAVANNTAQAIRRTLTGVTLPPTTIATVNPFTDRLAVRMILSNGSVRSLGVFLFVDDPIVRASWGNLMQPRFSDQCFMLDQAISQSVGYPSGTNLSQILSEQFLAAGVTAFRVEATVLATTAPLAWPSGNTRRLAIMEQICTLAGFLPPYFANDGYGIARSAPGSGASATLTYALDSTSRVVADSVTVGDNLLTAPNVYIAMDTSASSGDVIARYYIPDSAPNSVANRGFEIPKVVEVPGVGDAVAALAAAQAAYLGDSENTTSLAFTGSPDPRHDTFDLVSIDGTTYLEPAWTLSPVEMQHDLQRQYG